VNEPTITNGREWEMVEHEGEDIDRIQGGIVVHFDGSTRAERAERPARIEALLPPEGK
jgi:hypothetical protein